MTELSTTSKAIENVIRNRLIDLIELSAAHGIDIEKVMHEAREKSSLDRGNPEAERPTPKALELKEAKQVAADAQAREAAEHTKQRDNDGRER
jgi:hypothetical protein